MCPQELLVVEDKFHFLFGRPVHCDLRHRLFEEKKKSIEDSLFSPSVCLRLIR